MTQGKAPGKSGGVAIDSRQGGVSGVDDGAYEQSTALIIQTPPLALVKVFVMSLIKDLRGICICISPSRWLNAEAQSRMSYYAISN